MPSQTFAPRGAVAWERDWQAQAGVTLFTATSAVTIASGTTFVDDLRAGLSGRGSESIRALGPDMDAGWTGAGNVTVGIDSDDRVYIENDAEGFDIVADPDNAVFGFDTAGQSAVLVSGTTYRATATSDWQRGPVLDARLRLDPASGAAFDSPAYAYRAQGVVQLLRARGTIADADDTNAADCIEALDNAANDAVLKRIRWYIGADGYVHRTRPTGVSAAPTWQTTDAAKALRRELGFTGDEAETTVSGLEVLKASLPALITPSRPFERLLNGNRWTGDAVELTDGAVAMCTIANRATYELTFLLDGPADCIDQAQLFALEWLPQMPPGAKCSIYQDWGDGRRTLRPRDVDASQPAYSLLYTSEKRGERGRLLVRRAADSVAASVVRWPSRVQRSVPVTLRFTEREGGQ